VKFGLLVLLAAVSFAHAQSAPTLQPSAASQCLTAKGGPIPPLQYPDNALRRKDQGEISIELSFAGPDAAPRVRLLNSEPVIDDLEWAVRGHVDAFRVPCMKAGDPPVTMRQTYVFIPNDGRKVMSTVPADQDDAAREKSMRCIKHIERTTRPTYPVGALRRDEQGKVIAVHRFTGADAPPEVQIDAASHAALRTSVESYASGLRMPCLQDQPVSVYINYIFRIDGGSRTLLRDLALQTLVRGLKRPLPPAYFDFTTMGCPFDLRLSYYRPHRRNVVSELENTNPARAAFMDWLSMVTLSLDSANNTAILGDQITVSVPCGKLDL
jgi:hypothetical protein